MKLPYKMAIYDIENGKLKARIFPSNKPQYISHKQLCHGHKVQPIICISVKWFGDKQVHTFVGKTAVKDFVEFIKDADVVIGKNNSRFDDGHINTHRLIENLPPNTYLPDITDDVESQIRKHFNLPSYSLDYIAELLTGSGKDKMEDEDWNNIQDRMELEKIAEHIKSHSNELGEISKILYGKSVKDVVKDGYRSLNRMIKYNKKDVIKTEAVLKKIIPYIKLRKNASGNTGCITCGSTKLIPGKIITCGKTHYQTFECLSHKGYAGKCSWRWNKNRNKVYGKMG